MINVCVLISTYNGEAHIEKQLESIYAQKKVCKYGELNIDILVRDDGSTDSTIKILDLYRERYGLRWYAGKNLGAALSFLDLIKSSDRSDYYAFCDQDDYWKPEKLASAIDMLEDQRKEINKTTDNIPLLYGSNAELADYNLIPIGVDVYPAIPMLDYKSVSCTHGLLGCTMVFNYELASYIRSYDLPKKLVMHDFYLTLICGLVNGIIIFDNNSYMLYRQHHNNVCGISYGFFNKIIAFFRSLYTVPKVSVSDQAGEIICLFGKKLDDTKTEWLRKVYEYNDNTFNRLRLALSREYHLYSFKRTLSMRLKIFFGKL